MPKEENVDDCSHYTRLLNPTIEQVTVVAAALGSKFHAVAAVPGSGTGGLNTTPLFAGTGSDTFVVLPSLISTVIFDELVLQITTDVR